MLTLFMFKVVINIEIMIKPIIQRFNHHYLHPARRVIVKG